VAEKQRSAVPPGRRRCRQPAVPARNGGGKGTSEPRPNGNRRDARPEVKKAAWWFQRQGRKDVNGSERTRKWRAGEGEAVVIVGEKGCVCPRGVELLRAQRRASRWQSGCRGESHPRTALEARPAFETSEVHHVTERRPRRGARSGALTLSG
jgi:hypothetical protein